MTELTLFSDRDHKNRPWLITAKPHDGQLIVSFRCWNVDGCSKALDKSAVWDTEGWDLASPWLPSSPRPVPDPILAVVERQLKELVRQQQAQRGGGVCTPPHLRAP